MTRKRRQPRDPDEVREAILQLLYDKYKCASTPKKMRLKISEIKKSLKSKGFESNEIVSNLEYLVQTGWIATEEEVYEVRAKGRIIPSKTVYYKISDKGVNHFEGTSRFQRTHVLAGINITNIQGVITIGDGNIVNVRYGELYQNLSLLLDEISKTDKLSDEEKLNIASDIETIKIQLQKPDPDKTIISKAWDSLKSFSKKFQEVKPIMDIITNIGTLIEGLL